jgi:hypothetical protein
MAEMKLGRPFTMNPARQVLCVPFGGAVFVNW